MSFASKLMAVDLDEVFAYKTVKVVRMLDRRLGLTFQLIKVLIVLYIVVFVFGINEGYLESEIALGQVHISVIGATYSKVDGSNLPFDAIDLRQPELENGALFITTKLEAVKQTRGECENPEYSCAVDKDCPAIDGVSSQTCENGLCVMSGWCPGLNPDTEDTTLIRMERPEDLVLWFRSAISFPGIAPNQTYSSMNHEEPIFTEDKGPTDAWTLKEILEKADAPLNAIKEDGAMLNVRLEWECLVDSGGCGSPEAQVKRLDEGKVRGFSFFKPEYVREPSLDMSKDVRLLYKYTGVRVLVSSKGTGKKFSVLQTILQFSSGLALLSVAGIVTDFLMMHVMPEKVHYRKYKEELTPDFSDLRDKIVENEDAKQKMRGRQNRYRVKAEGEE